MALYLIFMEPILTAFGGRVNEDTFRYAKEYFFWITVEIIALFGAAHESQYYTDFAVGAFRIYLCMMTLATFNKGCFIYLQAMGKAVPSMMISMVREIVFGVGFALILPRFFGLTGVLYSMPVSDVLTFIISAIICVRIYRELSHPLVAAASKKKR